MNDNDTLFPGRPTSPYPVGTTSQSFVTHPIQMSAPIEFIAINFFLTNRKYFNSYWIVQGAAVKLSSPLT